MPNPSPPDLIKKVLEYGKRPDSKLLMQATSDARYVSEFVELEKGCLLYMFDEAYPMKFCTFRENELRATMLFKRFIPEYLKFIKSKGWFGKLLTVLSLKVNYTFYRDYFYWVLNDTYREVDRYSDTVREVYRVIPFEKEREMICSILEHDTGYRYPFQDVVSNLDKHRLKQNPHKEVKRLFDLAISRFPEQDAEKFKNIYKVLSVYFMVNRKFFKTVVQILEEINVEVVAPSVEDTYWMYWSKIYRFFGMSNEDRLVKYYELKNKKT